MDLKLIRYSSQKNDTLGLFFNENKFNCYTLEDEHRFKKVKGETRIQGGKYRITLRKEGGFHARYQKRFPDIHKGMLWIRDVPNFEWVLIHCGNTEKHTAGCILVGNSATQNITGNGFIGSSVKAYERIYPTIATALENNEDVSITIMDIA